MNFNRSRNAQLNSRIMSFKIIYFWHNSAVKLRPAAFITVGVYGKNCCLYVRPFVTDVLWLNGAR